MAEPLHPTCVETTTYDEAAADGSRVYVCGRGCPRPADPDPERDRRRAAYRRREHARIVAAFDRFLRETFARPDENPHDIYHDVFQPDTLCALSDTDSASYPPVAHKCQLRVPRVCTTYAPLVGGHVHHRHGKAACDGCAADREDHLLASCEACNLHVGDPSRDADPPNKGVTTW